MAMYKSDGHGGLDPVLEPQDNGEETRCPECGAISETYYRRDGQIIGCENCIETVYWYEIEPEEQ